jgi:hypothetical protein
MVTIRPISGSEMSCYTVIVTDPFYREEQKAASWELWSEGEIEPTEKAINAAQRATGKEQGSSVRGSTKKSADPIAVALADAANNCPRCKTLCGTPQTGVR